MILQLNEASQMQRLKEKVTTMEEEKETLERKVLEETRKMETLQDLVHERSPDHSFSEEEQGYLCLSLALLTDSIIMSLCVNYKNYYPLMNSLKDLI